MQSLVNMCVIGDVYVHANLHNTDPGCFHESACYRMTHTAWRIRCLSAPRAFANNVPQAGRTPSRPAIPSFPRPPAPEPGAAAIPKDTQNPPDTPPDPAPHRTAPHRIGPPHSSPSHSPARSGPAARSLWSRRCPGMSRRSGARCCTRCGRRSVKQAWRG
jgi:hypothetical protein